MYYNSKLIFARMLSEDAGITLKTSDDDKVVLTHERGKYVINMPALDANLSDDDPRTIWWWGSFCSLLDRLSGKSKSLEVQAGQLFSANSMFGKVMNQVLASNATQLNMGQYEGKDNWVVNSMDQSGSLYESSLKTLPPDPNNKNEMGMINTVLFDQMCKSIEYGTYCADYAPSHKKIQEMANDEALVDRMLKPKTSLQELIRTTKDILSHLDFDPDEEEEKSKEQQKKEQQSGQQGEGDEEGQGDSGGDGDEDGAESRQAPGTVNFKDLNKDKAGGDPNGGLTITYDEDDLYDSDSYVPINLTVTQMNEDPLSSPHTSDKLSKQVANLLKVRSQVRWEGNKKQGRLRNRSLARAASDPFYDSPFKRKINSNTLDTCVLLLVDTSGSMSGERYEMAMESAIKLCDTLSGVHIPTSVVGFTQRRTNDMLIHKDFTSKYDPNRLYANLKKGRNMMGCNDDGASLDWSHEYIHKQKQKRKIIIVLSDGQPSCDYERGNPAAYLKSVATAVEKDTDIFAIGIQTNSVKDFYSNSQVLRNVEDLEATVINVIKNQII